MHGIQTILNHHICIQPHLNHHPYQLLKHSYSHPLTLTLLLLSPYHLHSILHLFCSKISLYQLSIFIHTFNSFKFLFIFCHSEPVGPDVS